MTPLLEARGLQFRRPEKNILKNINFALNPGESAIILGRSGAGKGLLLRLCAGIFKPTGGDILFSGVPLEEMNYPARQSFQRQIGFVFDGKAGLLHNLNLYENIILPLTYFGQPATTARAIIQRYIDDFQLPVQENFWDLFPYQCNHLTFTLAQFFRAILAGAKIFFLDNPFNHQGTKIAQGLFEFIGELQGRIGFSLLIALNYININLKRDNRYFFLEEGTLQEGDKLKALEISTAHIMENEDV